VGTSRNQQNDRDQNQKRTFHDSLLIIFGPDRG
jgi:hypothetical protein